MWILFAICIIDIVNFHLFSIDRWIFLSVDIVDPRQKSILHGSLSFEFSSNSTVVLSLYLLKHISLSKIGKFYIIGSNKKVSYQGVRHFKIAKVKTRHGN